MRVGFHVSIIGDIDKAVDRAIEVGCNTFQIFTRTPRAWKAKKLTEEETKAFIEKVGNRDVKPVFSHMPYVVNLASSREDVYLRSVDTLKGELDRCEKLEIPYLVTHLGSHLGAGMGSGFENAEYQNYGAILLKSAHEIFSTADMIVKVKEPQPSELKMIQPDQIIFTYFNFAASEELTHKFIKTAAVAVAYETVEQEDSAGASATAEQAQRLEGRTTTV